MAENNSEKKNGKKSHTARNVTITAVILAALFGGTRFGLGFGQGDGNSLLNTESGSTAPETTQAVETTEPEASEPVGGETVLSIVVREDKILYQGRGVSLSELEEALLNDYTAEMTVSLTDDHAIKAAYDEVTALLAKLEIAYE